MPDQRPNSPQRRRLLIAGAAAVGAGTAAALHFKPWYRPLGANSDIRLGIAGLGGKGIDHCKEFSAIPGARITALCDPDPNQFERAFSETKIRREAVSKHADFRNLIEDGEVDAIVIASPNHWHALMGVWAMQAGKHVYVEKPIAHSIWEGEQLVAAAEKYGRIAQAGTQRRSDQAYPEAAAWLAEGNLGKIISAQVVFYHLRSRVTRRKSPTPLPQGIDFDHWTGPAPTETLYRSKLHYHWHWHWSTGNGELGNNGIHFLDVARILLGADGLPESATSVGGRFGYTGDAGQTPNTQLTFFNYPVPLVAEIRNLPVSSGRKAMDQLKGIREGLVIECEGGTLAWPVAKDRDGKKLKKFDSHDGYGHRVNWLKAIADDRPQDLNAPLHEAHLSGTLCHLGNASHRRGTATPTDQISPRLADWNRAEDAIQNLAAHLAANGVDLQQTALTLGPPTSKDQVAAAPQMRAPYSLTS